MHVQRWRPTGDVRVDGSRGACSVDLAWSRRGDGMRSHRGTCSAERVSAPWRAAPARSLPEWRTRKPEARLPRAQWGPGSGARAAAKIAEQSWITSQGPSPEGHIDELAEEEASSGEVMIVPARIDSTSSTSRLPPRSSGRGRTEILARHRIQRDQWIQRRTLVSGRAAGRSRGSSARVLLQQLAGDQRLRELSRCRAPGNGAQCPVDRADRVRVPAGSVDRVHALQERGRGL